MRGGISTRTLWWLAALALAVMATGCTGESGDEPEDGGGGIANLLQTFASDRD